MSPVDNTAPPDTPEKARALLSSLRDGRKFDKLDAAFARLAPALAADPMVARLQAQSLIDRGKLSDALGRLGALARRLGPAAPEFVEAKGLMGRVNKQAFFDAADKSSAAAQIAIADAVTNYEEAYKASTDGGVWPGLNLLALATLGRRDGIPAAAHVEPRALALKLLAALDATPPDRRDGWYHASRAEAYLGLGDLDAVEMHIGAYARSPASTAFALGGTLRQFTEVWQLDQQDERGRGIVQALRAALLKDTPHGQLTMTASDVQQSLSEAAPTDAQLQKILGSSGPISMKWLLRGFTMARAVGAIRTMAGQRTGTGFLVRGGDVVPALGDELLVVTNSHVISDPPAKDAHVPGDVEITFEAVDPDTAYGFSGIVWQSPPHRLDCCLLRLSQQPAGIEPLKLDATLPRIPPEGTPGVKPRVFIIGHPNGQDLAFSLQDNELLDHEAPPNGTPPMAGICRVQYRAPTAPGSSGSPVFNTNLWRVIALHHAGDEKGMQKLNGRAGTWPANEGIWIQSIVQAARAEKGGG